MNAKTLIIAAALACAGTASFADEIRDYATPSTLTRAEVQTRTAQARADRQLMASEAYGSVPTAVLAQRAGQAPANALTRADVQRSLAQDRAQGGSRFTGEAYGAVQPGLFQRSREDARAEAVAAGQDRAYGDRSRN